MHFHWRQRRAARAPTFSARRINSALAREYRARRAVFSAASVQSMIKA
jgi:hypothetical protein